MNLFQGTLEATTIYGEDDYWKNYYLSNGTEGIGYYKASAEGTHINANRSYLQVPKRESSGARGEAADATPKWSDMIISDEDDDIIAIPVYGSTNGEDEGTTDIQSSMFNVQSPDVYYNLQGQRVDNPGKGLYIKNGKKVLIQ